MESEKLPLFGNNIDKSQVPPIHQKRILAFVNHFVIDTVTFLNKFVINCENKFISFETKLQRVEANLVIVEAKLDSIQGIEQIKSADVVDSSPKKQTEISENTKTVEEPKKLDDVAKDVPVVSASTETPDIVQEEIQEIIGVKTCEDARYRKYFKMMQFGVPMTAVKLKMSAEGFDSSVLDDPEKILPDGIPHQVTEEI